MRIEQIELYHVEIPLDAPFYPSWIPGYPQMFNHMTFARLLTDEGIVGETAGVEFQKAHAGYGSAIGPFLAGRDPFDVEGFLDVIEAAQVGGLRLCWLEPALWDIMGKACGQPVYRLLGGGRGRLKAYASTGELHPAEKRVEEVLALREAGFRAVKLRMHAQDFREDLRVVERVREAVGDSMDIMVDANQGWRVDLLEKGPVWDVNTAVSVARELERLGVLWLEEPLDRMDYTGMREVREKTNMRVAAGELNSRFQEFRELVRNRSADILQPDACMVGGIAVSKKIAALCQAENLRFAPHTWTNGIGLLINMQVMASTPTAQYCEYPIEPPGWTPEKRDAILAEPVRIDREGFVTVPEAPGLGLRIDEEKLSTYGEKFFSA